MATINVTPRREKIVIQSLAIEASAGSQLLDFFHGDEQAELNRANVIDLVKHLEAWLKTGSLDPLIQAEEIEMKPCPKK